MVTHFNKFFGDPQIFIEMVLAKKVKNPTISILWLKCWVPFFSVLGHFVILGGLGGYPL